jgi:hypothetical protein
MFSFVKFIKNMQTENDATMRMLCGNIKPVYKKTMSQKKGEKTVIFKSKFEKRTNAIKMLYRFFWLLFGLKIITFICLPFYLYSIKFIFWNHFQNLILFFELFWVALFFAYLQVKFTSNNNLLLKKISFDFTVQKFKKMGFYWHDSKHFSEFFQGSKEKHCFKEFNLMN